MKKILFLIFIFTFSCGSLLAQEGISSTVEVKREFEGRLLEISKSKLDTKYSDTLTKLHLNFDYSIFDRPIKDLYEFSPMQSAHLNREGLVRYPVLYAKIAASYPWMPEADIYVQPRFGDRFSMVLYGNHHSYWGHKGVDTLGPAIVNRMTNRGGVNMAYVWKNGEITANAYYFHSLYDFNNYDYMSDTFKKSTTFQQIGADIRVRSTNPNPVSFHYDVLLKYLNAYRENRLDAYADFGLAFHKRHKVILGIRSSTSFYNDTHYNFSSGYFQVVPHYKLDLERWSLKAGLAFNIPYAKDFVHDYIASYADTSLRKVDIVSPEVYASFEAAKNALWLYIRANGENELISLSSILNQNPWAWTDTSVPPLSGVMATPIRAEFGLNGVVKDLFSYSLSASYSYYYSYVSYYPVLSSQKAFALHDIDALYVKAEALFKTKSFSAGASGKYTYFFDQNSVPYMVPSFIVNAFGKYNYRERIFFELNLNYYSSMKGYGVESVPGFVDLGAKFTFALNSKISIFAQGQNLINQKVMYIQNYLEPGINFGLGLYLKL